MALRDKKSLIINDVTDSEQPTDSSNRFLRNLRTATLVVLAQAALSAAYGAAGAAILSKTGHDDYNVTESSLLTTMGSTMLTASVALIALLCACCKKNPEPCCPETKLPVKIAACSFASAVLGSLLAHTLFSNNPDISTHMPIEKVAAAAATGAAAIMSIPACIYAGK